MCDQKMLLSETLNSIHNTLAKSKKYKKFYYYSDHTYTITLNINKIILSYIIKITPDKYIELLCNNDNLLNYYRLNYVSTPLEASAFILSAVNKNIFKN